MNLKSFNNSTAKTIGFAVTALALSLGATAPAQAVSVFYGNMFTGATQFDNTVTGAGGTPVIDTWTTLASGTSVNRGAYTLTRNNGGSIVGQNYNLFGASPTTPTSGQVVSIAPSSTNVLQSKSSGIKFSFNTPVNALGFEVGDWGTCCQPSSLYIAFDGGTPIKVGQSLVSGDANLTNNGYGVFVGAIDDSSKFSTVEFWGDGAGEALYAGGKIRYADLAIGSVSNPANSTDVPEPFTIVGTLIGGTAALRMRKKLKSNDKV
jgi:hypothetical protein